MQPTSTAWGVGWLGTSKPWLGRRKIVFPTLNRSPVRGLGPAGEPTHGLRPGCFWPLLHSHCAVTCPRWLHPDLAAPDDFSIWVLLIRLIPAIKAPRTKVCVDFMAKEKIKKPSNGSALDFEAQLWAAAEQAVPASILILTEYHATRPEELFDPKSEWFIKDEPQRADAAENRDATIFGGHGLSTPFAIPTGLQPSVQGCRGPRPDWPSEATLGSVIHYFTQPQRGCANRACADGCNPFRNLCKSPVAALCERRRASHFQQKPGGHRPPLQPKMTFAEISFRVDELLGRFPRVAPRQSGSDQPWAECHYPVGVNECRADLPPDLMADLMPVWKDLATATRRSAKTTLAKPDRRSVGETELHPPFNMSDWGCENLWRDVRCFSLSASLGERAGVRCRNHSLPVNNANYAWIQDFIHHLSPVGVAEFAFPCQYGCRRATETRLHFQN